MKIIITFISFFLFASVNAGDTTAPWILWLAGIAIAGTIFMMLYWAVVNRPPSIRTPMPIGA